MKRKAFLGDGREDGRVDLTCPDVLFVTQHKGLLEGTRLRFDDKSQAQIELVDQNRLFLLNIDDYPSRLCLASDNASALDLGARGYFDQKRGPPTGWRQLTWSLDTRLDLAQTSLEFIVQKAQAVRRELVFLTDVLQTLVLSYLVCTLTFQRGRDNTLSFE